MRKSNPFLTILAGFASVIAVGTILLVLPISTTDGKGLPFLDAVFTATSATCVTGLSTISVQETLSGFGQSILLLMVQIGGLGLMTISTFFILLLGIRPKLSGKIVLREALNQVEEFHAVHLIRRIILFTVIMETAGAAVFFTRMKGSGSFSRDLYIAVFHSISAFCNAGFTLFSNSLEAYRTDAVINISMMVLIICGGLGFWVVRDIYENLKSRIIGRTVRPLSLQAKVVLIMSGAFIVVGTILFMIVEGSRSMGGLSGSDLVWSSLFQSVTTRTAGFSTVSIGALSIPTLVWMTAWMFIGASPGSTGGGIKTTTFVVMLASFRSVFTGSEKVEIMRNSLPEDVVRRANAVFLAATAWVLVTVLMMEIAGVSKEVTTFLPVLFETMSAFGTVGLSMGITGSLTGFGKIVLSLSMFAGRVGPMSLILALAQRPDRPEITYPEGMLSIG